MELFEFVSSNILLAMTDAETCAHTWTRAPIAKNADRQQAIVCKSWIWAIRITTTPTKDENMPEANQDFCMDFEAEEKLSLPPTPEKKVEKEEEPQKKKGFMKNPFKYTTRNTVKEPKPIVPALEIIQVKTDVSNQSSALSGTMSAKQRRINSKKERLAARKEQ